MKILFFLLYYLAITGDASPIPSLIADASLASSQMSDSTEKVCLWTYWSVYIINMIPDPIVVHPQSADDDLGNRRLTFGNHTDWNFCLHAFLKTLYYAHFYWKSKTAFFDVYTYHLGESYCKDGDEFFKQQRCYWIITQDGFYLTKNPNKFLIGATKLHIWS
ncbi:putative plant self-incompatibility S1 [Helianthus annuus]|nr:putative plant self-incompatibility S1 [Helianthus annuus]